MRFLMGWALKLSVVGVIYLGMTSGFTVKLPEEVLGYKVPVTAQQWVDRNTPVASAAPAAAGAATTGALGSNARSLQPQEDPALYQQFLEWRANQLKRH